MSDTPAWNPPEGGVRCVAHDCQNARLVEGMPRQEHCYGDADCSYTLTEDGLCVEPKRAPDGSERSDA